LYSLYAWLLFVTVTEKSNKMMLTMLQRAARHWNSDSPDDWILNVADRRSAGKQHLE